MEIKLNLCKCGGTPFIDANFGGGPYYVKCPLCNRETTIYELMEQAINAWNQGELLNGN